MEWKYWLTSILTSSVTTAIAIYVLKKVFEGALNAKFTAEVEKVKARLAAENALLIESVKNTYKIDSEKILAEYKTTLELENAKLLSRINQQLRIEAEKELAEHKSKVEFLSHTNILVVNSQIQAYKTLLSGMYRIRKHYKSEISMYERFIACPQREFSSLREEAFAFDDLRPSGCDNYFRNRVGIKKHLDLSTVDENRFFITDAPYQFLSIFGHTVDRMNSRIIELYPSIDNSSYSLKEKKELIAGALPNLKAEFAILDKAYDDIVQLLQSSFLTSAS